MDRWNGRRLEKGGGAVSEKEKGLEKRGKQEQNEATESVAWSRLTRSGGGEECCVWKEKKKKETRRGWSERELERKERERENRCEGKEGEKVERERA